MISAQYSSDGGFRYAEMWRDGSFAHADGMKAPNFFRRIRSDLGAPVRFPARVNAAPLALHVAHIVRLRAKEQMRRLNAKPVVASMANKHRAYGAHEKFVCRPMREHMLACQTTGPVSAASVLGAGPDKAPARLAPRLREESRFGIFEAVPAVSAPVHGAHCALNCQERQEMEGLAMGNGQLQGAAIELVGREEVLN